MPEALVSGEALYPDAGARGAARLANLVGRMWSDWAARSAALLLLGAWQPAQSQHRVVVDERETCSRCRIEVSGAVRLFAPPSAKGFTRHAIVARDSRGRFYVADAAAADQVSVFDVNGRYVRGIGRPGRGPGEFNAVSAMAFGEADTLHVFGTHHATFTEEGEFVRAQYILGTAQVLRALALPGGRVLLQSMVPTPELSGIPLHVSDGQGRVIASFGALPGVPLRGEFWERFRAVALAGPDQVWSAAPNTFRLELWSVQGELLRVLERRCSWCTPWDRWSGVPQLDRPPPIVDSLLQDGTRLWVLTTMADAAWRPEAGPERGREILPPRVSRNDRMFDSVIDVIDLSTGRLIKSQRFDALLRLLPGLWVAQLGETEDGEVFVKVSQLSLNARR